MQENRSKQTPNKIVAMEQAKDNKAFEETYRYYLSQIADLDPAETASRLGCSREGQELLIPLYGRTYRVGPAGMVSPEGKRPIHAEVVLFSKHLLLAPEVPAEPREWASFQDFKDGAPFAAAFANQVEKGLAQDFSGRSQELEQACERLNGQDPQMGLSYTICRSFRALPRINVLLLFDEMDEEFPAEAKILFPDNINHYLDMECVAILGWLLKDYLRLAVGGREMSII